MIANAYSNEWRQTVPWSDNKMVEQDLIISRLLVELFNHPKISDSLAFLNQWNTNVFDLWMFYLKETNEWIGRSGLRRINLNGSEEIEIGYALIVTEDTLDNLAATWDENHAKE